MRLLAGIVWIAGIGADPSSTFYRLNLTLYTPLCAALAIASVIVLRAPDQPAAAPTIEVPPTSASSSP